MPPPHRLDPRVVADLLERSFPDGETLAPSGRLSREIMRRCSDHGIAGGGVYDAVVGLTAAEAGALLLTRDVRAARTYDRLGVSFELLG
jgi:predicted nucleic acid-binding protein